jgi:ABC-type transport system involved in multi-copper enzyme maturation permease subunit
MMIWKIARKDFLSNLLTLRFAVGMALVIFLTFLFTSILISDYSQNLVEYNNQVTKSTDELEQIKVYQNLSPAVHKPPEILALFSKGIEENVARSARVSVFDVPVLSGTGTTKNPLFPVFPVLDVVLIFKLVVVILILLCAYDAVSGEKENGTLRLIFSNSIPRHQVVFGKFLGGMLTSAIPVLTGFLISCLMLEFSPMVNLDDGEWMRIGFMLLLTLIMTGIFVNISLFISSLTKKSSDTLMLLLLIWVFFLLIVPNAGSYMATRIKPIESRAKINAQIMDIQNRLNENISEIRRRNPEDPDRVYIQSDGMGPMGFYMYYGTKAEVERRLILNPQIGRLRMDTAREIEEVNRQYLNSLVIQKRWTEQISRISPLSFYENLMSTLSRTDYLNLENFSRSAGEYRQKLVDYFQKRDVFSSIRFFGTMKIEDVFEAQENRDYGRYMMLYANRNPESLDLSDLPAFIHLQDNVLDTLKKIIPELSMLIGIGIFFFMATFVALLRYDVR